MAVQPLTADIARDIGVDQGTKGLVIAAVGSNSNAGSKGLRRGDVILSINRSPVTTAEALAKGVADAKKAGRSAVLLEILPRGQQPALVHTRVAGNNLLPPPCKRGAAPTPEQRRAGKEVVTR